MKGNNTDKRDRVLKNNKRFEFRKEWLVPVAILIIGAAAVIFWPREGESTLNFGNSLVSYKKVKAVDGRITLPVADFDDHNVRYYAYKFPEKPVFFFALKSSDGVIRAAFDACDVCFQAKKGYRQDGDLMVCNNCGQVFPSVRINVEKGGCNPAPLERSVVGSELVINVSDIYQGVKFF